MFVTFREHNLVMLFGKFGNVEGAEILYNDRGSKGFGFVTMSRGQDADLARARLNNAIVEGRVIEADWSALIGRGPTLLRFHWSRVSLVILAPAILYAIKN